MEYYFLKIAVMFLLVGLLAIIKINAVHQRNNQMINLELMHSREIAEALVGKVIDSDN